MTPEGMVKSQVCKLLQKCGYYVIRNLQGGIRHVKNHPGISDLTVIRWGVVTWMEIKTEDRRSKSRPAQIEFRRDIESAGGNYVIIRSLADAVEWEKEQHARTKALSLADAAGIGSTAVEAG